jgi:Tfp pilus assembly PilM family ATPase
MKTETTSFCGLDLQRDYFSIVQYSSLERAVTLLSIQAFAEKKGATDWKIWKKELKKSRGRLRFFAPAVVFGMPSEYAAIKLVRLDPDEELVADTVEWELGQHIGGALDEYVLDFEEIGGGSASEVRSAIAVAYRKELVARASGLVRDVKMMPLVVDLDIFALINVFEANYAERTSADSLIVFSEPEKTKLVMTRGGGYRNYHCFEHSSGAVDPSGFASLLSSEIDRFASASDVKGRRPDVYITGSYFQQEITCDAFFEKVNGAELLDPFRTVKCQVKIDAQQLRKYSTQLAVAAGLALRGAAESGDEGAGAGT